jgi:hypothetical protein
VEIENNERRNAGEKERADEEFPEQWAPRSQTSAPPQLDPWPAVQP